MTDIKLKVDATVNTFFKLGRSAIKVDATVKTFFKLGRSAIKVDATVNTFFKLGRSAKTLLHWCLASVFEDLTPLNCVWTVNSGAFDIDEHFQQQKIDYLAV